MNVSPEATSVEEVGVAAEAAETELVEVGEVSATQGSIYGAKPDTGVGVTFS